MVLVMGKTRHYYSDRLRDKWSEGIGMPTQRFSIGESCALLNIDRVTLTRWLAAEQMTPQTDVVDRRFKYLTREQITRLATIHERSIREETSGPRLTSWQRSTEAQIHALEARIMELEASRIILPRYTPLERQQTALPEPVPYHATEPLEAPESHYSAPYTPSGATGARDKLKVGEWGSLQPIPDGWLSPLDMARALGIPPRTFNHELMPRDADDRERHGTIGYHRGKWRRPHPGLYATELLDPQQQEDARALFAAKRG